MTAKETTIRDQVDAKKRGPGRPRKRGPGRPRKSEQKSATVEATEPPSGRPALVEAPEEAIPPTVPANERPPTNAEDEILSISQAAAMVGRTPRCVRGWIEDGVIKSGKFPSGLTGIRRSVVDEVLRQFPIGGKCDGQPTAGNP